MYSTVCVISALFSAEMTTTVIKSDLRSNFLDVTLRCWIWRYPRLKRFTLKLSSLQRWLLYYATDGSSTTQLTWLTCVVSICFTSMFNLNWIDLIERMEMS